MNILSTNDWLAGFRSYSYLVAATLSLAALPAQGQPAWWTTRGAVDNQPSQDYTTVNLGQLKHFTRKGVDELNSRIPGGAGSELNTLIVAWVHAHPDPKDFQVANVGQLKWIGAKFDARLRAVYFRDASPFWQVAIPATDEQVANIGQLKTVFNFDLRGVSGQLPDWWMKFYFNGVTGIDPNGDADHDGLTNLFEWEVSATNPTISDRADLTAQSASEVLQIFTPFQ